MLSLLVALALPQSPPQAEEHRYLMFFMKGTGARPAEEAKLKELMEGHLGNMGALVKTGDLVAAGPLNDPTGERRGITVLIGKPKVDLEALFKNDPFVAAKIMEPVAYKWDVPAKSFHPNDVDPTKIAPHFLVLYKRGTGMSPETPAMWKVHDETLSALKTPKRAVEGPLEGAKWSRAAIYVGEEREPLEKALKEDPLVRRRLLEFEIVPLWMGAGVVKG